MATALFVILPIFMLLGVGWLLRLRRFPGEEFWRLLDPLVYYVLFPAMLVRNFANVDVAQLDVLPAAGAALVAMLAATALLLLLRRHLALNGPAFTSLVQSTVRFNSYIGFAVAAGLYQDAGLTIFSIIVAFVIPLANLISIGALSRYGRSSSSSNSGLWLAVFSNPIILSVVLGVILSISGIGLPWVFDPFLDVLGRAALPLGLLAAGAGLDFKALHRSGRTVIMACLARLLAMPLLVLGMLWVFEVDGLSRMAAMIYALMPVPPGSYILARQLGGDAALLAAVIAASTVLAIVTVPMWIFMLS
ncbi:MAG: AEC family transporter [Proteobacteria bacterium]|nr:AEC family transporter [Pseudomonadota bacterium]